MRQVERLVQKLVLMSQRLAEVEAMVEEIEAKLPLRLNSFREAEPLWLEAHTLTGKVRRRLESLRNAMETAKQPSQFGIEGPDHKIRDEPNDDE